PNGEGAGLWTAIVAGGSFLVQIIMNVGTFIWVLSRSRNATDDKIANKDKAMGGELTLVERRMRDAIEKVSRDCGEMGHALREKIIETDQKITQTELWNRDNFVHKGTFTLVMQRIDERWDRFEDKLDKREDKFDKRLDSIEDKL